jgi:hypothetical protein
MAKKDNEALYQEFLADLEKINPKIKEVLDDATNAKLKDSVLARAEFSRQSDALSKERADMEAYLTQEKQKIEGWQNWYGEASKTFAGTQEQLKAYKDAYGELDASDKRREAANHGMSQADFEKALNDRFSAHDVAAIKFADDLTDLKIEHRDKFKEKLDTTAVFKIAGEKNLPLDIAYNLYIGDRVKELQATELAEKIKQERADAVAEFATKHNLPVVSSTPDWVHALDVKQPLTTANERISAAVSDFMKRPQK